MVELKDIVILRNGGQGVLKEAQDRAARLLPRIKDRKDLHGRDEKERSYNVLMGCVAEELFRAAMYYNNKNCEYSLGLEDDLFLEGKRVSIKSSYSKTDDIQFILDRYHLATTPEEITDINVQVFFWGPKEIELRRMGIFAWASREDLQKVSFSSYNQFEERLRPDPVIKRFRPIRELI